MCAIWMRPDVSSATDTSRSTMIDSAAPGIPFKPSMAAVGPSCATPSPFSDGSSQWSITGMLNIDAYSSARRISRAVSTGRPSSVMATHPAFTRSPISVSCVPFEPIETAPMGNTRARLASAARFKMNSVTDAESLTGVVLGIHATAVNPPATADAVPVATVSLCSWPGSRRCT